MNIDKIYNDHTFIKYLYCLSCDDFFIPNYVDTICPTCKLPTDITCKDAKIYNTKKCKGCQIRFECWIG